MAKAEVARGETALHRNALSRPVSLAVQDGLITESTSFFDYGCGRSGDVRRLKRQGVSCAGWDPVHSPRTSKKPADIVNLGFVANVIDDPAERDAALREAWGLAQSLLIVSARLIWELRDVTGLKRFSDGFLTSRGTFQKPYTQEELRAWIEETIDGSPVAAAPGVFYVFRDRSEANAFLATRYRYRPSGVRAHVSKALFAEHQELLEELSEFLDERGRLPRPEEFPLTSEVIEHLGSLRRAFAVIRNVTGKERWEERRRGRTEDLQVYLALARFGGRPTLSELPPDVQYDIKDFYGTYKKACEDADGLLFAASSQECLDEACRESPVGKLTYEALYIHTSALDALPPLLRVYEGCARALTGSVEEAAILKMHRRKPQVSYLAYPRFEKDPHPALSTVLIARLGKLQIDFKDFRNSENPPILHRKETFLPSSHPLHGRFARLTKQEERHGLLDEPRLRGNKDSWNERLRTAGLTLRGHQIVRSPSGDV